MGHKSKGITQARAAVLLGTCQSTVSKIETLVRRLEEIEHRTIQVRRPQSNGILERMHKTLLDEHFRIKGRTKIYEGLDEMQTDLDEYLKTYNQERAHQGRNMNGRTPYQAFVEGLPVPSTEVIKA